MVLVVWTPDVCGAVAPPLLSGDVPQAAVPPGEGRLHAPPRLHRPPPSLLLSPPLTHTLLRAHTLSYTAPLATTEPGHAHRHTEDAGDVTYG